MRHRDLTFDADQKTVLHEKLRVFGLRVPSQEEEVDNANTADDCYDKCVSALIERTREIDKFPLVFKTLTDYGFHRNLLGLKPVGLVITLLSLAVCGYTAYVDYQSREAIIALSLIGGIDIGLLGIWVTRVTESTVKKAAEEYAGFLLKAALNLEDR